MLGHLANGLAHPFQGVGVSRMDHALIGRRHIQQQGAVVAHRTKIQLKQSTRALNRAVLILGPEPTLTDGQNG